VQVSWLCQRTLEKVFARCIFTEANCSSAYWKGECNRFSDGKQSRTHAFIVVGPQQVFVICGSLLGSFEENKSPTDEVNRVF
ncbi:hypothetical protein JOQ06_013971, partial [Pogonophryne albipinna]